LSDSRAQSAASRLLVADAQTAALARAVGRRHSRRRPTSPAWISRGNPCRPNASARAFWSRSRGMVFSASNLPPLPAGRTYQLMGRDRQGPDQRGLALRRTRKAASTKRSARRRTFRNPLRWRHHRTRRRCAIDDR
jgi:hypothetical protein